jgi:hypothetical protein
LAKLKAATETDDFRSAFLSEQLQAEAHEAAGHVLRAVAGRVNLPELSKASEAIPYGGGRLLRGHRLAATAVALSRDDAIGFTVTKCGCALQWDVETGKRFVLCMCLL